MMDPIHISSYVHKKDAYISALRDILLYIRYEFIVVN